MPFRTFDMILHEILTVLTCLLAVQVSAVPKYGVGFSLSLDYGTASIYFANGTFINLAKIEGNPGYKHAMRVPDIQSQQPKDRSISDRNSEGSQHRLELRSIRNYLPPWLGGTPTHSIPLQDMLKALKVSTESYLGEPLSDVLMTAPFPVSHSFSQTLRSFCSSMSLESWIRHPAGCLAKTERYLNYTYGPDYPDEYLDRQLILSIDYNGAAMTAILASQDEDGAMWSIERILHSPSLGSENLHENPESVRAGLRDSLRQLTELPLTSYWDPDDFFEQIDELLFLGDAADSPQLHEVLLEVLHESLGDQVAEASYRGSGHLDPVFLAARGAAYNNWWTLDYNERRKGFPECC